MLDTLTNLPSLIDFIDYIRQENDEKFAIYINIDAFAGVNYTFGFSQGDIILKKFSSWLNQQAINHQSKLFRIGGDEFVLPMQSIEADCIELARNIIDETYNLKLPYGHPDNTRDILSISSVVFDIDIARGCDFTVLVDKLRDAVYQEKIKKNRSYSVLGTLMCDNSRELTGVLV